MRVVSELIDYLMARGSLTSEHVRWLCEKGYFEIGDLPSDYTLANDDSGFHDLEIADVQHELEARIPIRRPGRGKSGRPRSAFPPKELAKLLEEAIGSWREPLAGLLTLAQYVGPVEFEQMPQTLRSMEENTLQEAIADILTTGGSALGALWHAAVFDGWMRILPRHVMGPAANAFRILVANPSRSSVGAHAWLLRLPAVRWVYQLAQSQSRIQSILADLVESQPAGFLRCALETWDVVMYVAILQVWNARSWRKVRREMPVIETGPVTDLRLCDSWLYVLSQESHSFFDACTGAPMLTRRAQFRDPSPAIWTGSGDPEIAPIIAWVGGGRIQISHGSQPPETHSIFGANPLGFVSRGRALVLCAESGFNLYGTKPLKALKIHTGSTAGIAVTPAGQMLIASKWLEFQLYDLHTRAPLPPSLKLPEYGAIHHSASAVRRDQLWFCCAQDPAFGAPPYPILCATVSDREIRLARTFAVPSPVRGIALGGESFTLAAATDSGIYFFPLPSAAPAPEPQFPGEPIQHALWDPDGFWIVYHATGRSTLHDSDGSFLSQLGLPTGAPLAYIQKPKRLAVRLANPSIVQIVAWEADQPVGRMVQHIWTRLGPANLAAFSPDGARLAIATPGGVELHPVFHDQPPLPPVLADGVRAVAFGPDARTIIFESAQQNLTVVDLDHRERTWTPNPHITYLAGVCEDPAQDMLVTADRTGIICFWHLPDLKLLHILRAGYDLAGIAPAGDHFLAWSPGGMVLSVDFKMRTVIAKWRVPLSPTAFACTPDGSFQFAGDGRGLISVFRSGEECVAELRAHRARIIGLACAPDGKTLYSGAVDGAHAWNLDYYLGNLQPRAEVFEPVADEEQWKNAWSEALRLDPVHVTPFVAHFSRQHERTLQDILASDEKTYRYAELGLFPPP